MSLKSHKISAAEYLIGEGCFMRFFIESVLSFIQMRRTQIYRTALVLLLVLGALATAVPSARTVFLADAAKRKIPIYCVDTEEKKVAVSFDAAWGADDTETLLSILKENDIKATFFLCGFWVDKFPEEVKRIYEEGHDIGNHGNTHAHSTQLSLENNKKEIMGAHLKVKELLGIEMNLFRPPYGEYNNTVLEAAESSGYYTIQWDVDSMETKPENVL